MNSLYAIYALVAISSVQAWSPCRCHLIDNPVCGSDGVTYSNACFLDCAQKKINSSLSMVHEGHCKSQVTLNTCVCTIKYKPVCGSDGVTYDNMCEFRCAKKKNQSLHLERRDKSADVKDYSDDCCVCTMEYNPVCGSDGVTYGNPCVLKCAQVKDANLHVIRDGSCTGLQVNQAFEKTRTNPFAVPTV